MSTIAARQTVQTWGNSLAVRLNAKIALAANLQVGQPLSLEVVEGGVLLRPLVAQRETLAQKLARFDPALHGGEVMSGGPVGKERF